MRPIDLTGQKFGKLTVVSVGDLKKHGKRTWICRCECGNEKTVLGDCLVQKHTQSCGCIRNNYQFNLTKKFIINNNGCWEWTGLLSNLGYGKIGFKGKTKLVSRLVYEIFVGDIPKGLLVCHTCDNRKCINPDHLFLGTPKENMHDMIDKGRDKKCKGISHPTSKLTEKDVLEIRSKYVPRKNSYPKLAKEFGVADTTIEKIIKRKAWTHI